jgi:hypothetical protein
MRCLEPFRISERREADALQFFELRGVFRPGVEDGEPAGESAVVPHRCRERDYIYDGMLSM